MSYLVLSSVILFRALTNRGKALARYFELVSFPLYGSVCLSISGKFTGFVHLLKNDCFDSIMINGITCDGISSPVVAHGSCFPLQALVIGQSILMML